MLLYLSIWIFNDAFNVEVETSLRICCRIVESSFGLSTKDLGSRRHLTYALLGFDLAVSNQPGFISRLFDHGHEGKVPS